MCISRKVFALCYLYLTVLMYRSNSAAFWFTFLPDLPPENGEDVLGGGEEGKGGRGGRER